MSDQHRFFATVPARMEQLLADELVSLGGRKVKQTVAGCYFEGNLELGYRVALWTRLANTVLLPIEHFEAGSPEALYAGIQSVYWDEHMAPDASFMVTFHASQSAITHTKYGAQVVKDAVVDQFRKVHGIRPSVDLKDPDIHLNVHVFRDHATVSLDLSGDSLHRRSYRMQSVDAPLKENVAAAVLMRAGWPQLVEQAKAENAPVSLVDPMCGSGTLLIEGALMAADIAPGLLRRRFGVEAWRYHDTAMWQRLMREAETRREAGLRTLSQRVAHIEGSDIEMKAVRACDTNIFGAGLRDVVHVVLRDFRDAIKPEPVTERGLVVTNAPYGERLENDGFVVDLHQDFGQLLVERFDGWNASVLTGSKELGFSLGLRAKRNYSLYNGALECTLVNFELSPDVVLPPRSNVRKPSYDA